MESPPSSPSARSYDYLLKFLLVGDSDVGKGEIMGRLEDSDSEPGSPYYGNIAATDDSTVGHLSKHKDGKTKKEIIGSWKYNTLVLMTYEACLRIMAQHGAQVDITRLTGFNDGLPCIDHKTTTILLDGKRVKLQLWDTSGQGRFCTILRSYSRGAQGILLVYDITSRWSFDGIARWINEIDEHAPGVPKILVGNRLHLAFKRQVSGEEAQDYAIRNEMAYFEVSPLCDFNVTESLTELSRLVLKRNGMERLWRTNKVLSLQDFCCRTIVNCTSTYSIDKLPIPLSLRSRLKSFADANHMHRYMLPPLDIRSKKRRTILNAQDPPYSARKSCIVS